MNTLVSYLLTTPVVLNYQIIKLVRDLKWIPEKIWGNTRTLSRAYWNCFYPLTPKSERLLISFHKIKLEPNVKVRKANGMITKQRALIVKRILLRNQRKSMEKSMENIQSDFRIKNVRNSQELIKLTIRLNVSLI